MAVTPEEREEIKKEVMAELTDVWLTVYGKMAINAMIHRHPTETYREITVELADRAGIERPWKHFLTEDN